MGRHGTHVITRYHSQSVPGSQKELFGSYGLLTRATAIARMGTLALRSRESANPTSQGLHGTAAHLALDDGGVQVNMSSPIPYFTLHSQNKGRFVSHNTQPTQLANV